MTIRDLPGPPGDMPTFTYTRTKVTKTGVTRRTRHKAVSLWNGKKDYTRRITEHYIDPERWVGEKAPKWWPTGLQYPGDMLKAVMCKRAHDRISSDKSSKKQKLTAGKSKKGGDKKNGTAPAVKSVELAEFSKECGACGRKAKTIDKLCGCKKAPWDRRSTEAWREQHIDLRWAGDAFGIGVYALRAIRKDTVLGEYVGELVRTAEVPSTYLFTVTNDAREELGLIDSLRMGNWTRFINHSCDSNTDFVTTRVGGRMRYVVQAKKGIRVGQEVTISYGDSYWRSMNRKGIWCSCGADNCEFSEAAVKRRQGAVGRRT